MEITISDDLFTYFNPQQETIITYMTKANDKLKLSII